MREIIYNMAGEVVLDHQIPDTPLDALGALGTLLAVKGVLSVDEAAQVVGLDPKDLVAEAKAWAEFT